jgi:hypothetical protein
LTIPLKYSNGTTNKTTRKGQPGEDSQEKIARKGLPEQDSQNRIKNRDKHDGWDNQDKNVICFSKKRISILRKGFYQ